jgi:hypothetical protein
MRLDSAKLNDWMQVMGIFALVASLIFVGLQIKQEHEIARVQIYQERTTAATEAFISAASSPDAMAASVKSAFGDPNQEIVVDGWAGPITAQDLILGSFQVNAFMALADNSHYQYQEGFLPFEHWEGVRTTVKAAAQTTPFLLYRIKATMNERRAGFRDALEEIVAEIEAEARSESL